MIEKLVDIYGAPTVGKPLNFSIEMGMKKSQRGRVSRVIAPLMQSLRRKGYSLTRAFYAGACSEEEIILTVDDEDVRYHERCHAYVQRKFPDLDTSFEEGWVNAWTDRRFNLDDIEWRNENTRGLCSLHAQVINECSNGGLRSETEAQMLAIEDVAFFTVINWAAFLRTVQYNRYYSLFMNIYQNYGLKEGQEIIEDAACFASLGDLFGALEHLTVYAEFYQSDEARYARVSDNGEVGPLVFNTLPVEEDGLRSRHSLQIKGEDDFFLNLFTSEGDIMERADEVIGDRMSELERAIGEFEMEYY